MSNPVYDFLGYRVLEIDYHRNTNKPIKSFFVILTNSEFSKENNQYVIKFEVQLTFADNENVKLSFDSAFQINDMKWKESLSEISLNSLVFSACFPYVREKIYCITDDIRGAVQLPIVDLRGVDLSQGARFDAVYQKRNIQKN